jgi:cytochrome P450
VSKAFVPKVVNELRPDITELVDGLLDHIAERGRFDVISDLAYPLPVAVICRLLGVPLEDEPGSAVRRRCSRRRSTRSSRSPASRPKVCRSAFAPVSGCGNTCTT